MIRQGLKIVAMILLSMCYYPVANAAVGDVVASSTSQTWMDMVTCTQSVIQIGRYAEPEKLAYSGWTWFLDGSASKSVTITDSYDEHYDGVTDTVVLTGEGVHEWLHEIVGVHNVRMAISGGPTFEKTYMVNGPSVTIERGTDTTINYGSSCAITSSMEGATIYFTTDGTEPTTASRVYVGPFALNPTVVTTVKAFCVVEGWPRSQTVMKTFQRAPNLELVAAAGSGQVELDTCAGTGALEAKGRERIVWSGLWAADANADVSVTVNNEPFVSGRGEGVEEWIPPSAGTFSFLHTTAGSAETLTATFNVTAKDIALAQVAVDCGDVTYSGSAFTPAIQSVTWGGSALAAGTDYTFAYSDNVDAGIATITLTGIGFFGGTYTTNFTIRPKELTSAMVESVGNVVYTGSPHQPDPTVTDTARGETLVKGTDYTLSWGANTAAGSGSWGSSSRAWRRPAASSRRRRPRSPAASPPGRGSLHRRSQMC